MAYTQSNTDPVSVNGMYLNMYVKIIESMTDTFDNDNVAAFNLHAMLLRSLVLKKELRDNIDNEVRELVQKMDEGLYDLGKNQREYAKGFCAVTAAAEFIGSAFHIIQNDSSGLVDITDDDLVIQLEKYMMYKKTRYSLANNRDKLKLIEHRILDGSIPDMKALAAELTAADESIPQDSNITQEEAVNTFDDSGN